MTGLSRTIELFVEPRPPAPEVERPADQCRRGDCDARAPGNVCFRLRGAGDADANLAAYLGDCAKQVRAAEVQAVVAMTPGQRVTYFERLEKRRRPGPLQLLRREAWAAINTRTGESHGAHESDAVRGADQGHTGAGGD